MFQRNGQPLTQYYTKFKTLWQELQIYDPLPHCKCEAAKDHLLGLNGNFDRLRSNVLSMEPIALLSKFFSLALQEEQSFVG